MGKKEYYLEAFTSCCEYKTKKEACVLVDKEKFKGFIPVMKSLSHNQFM